MAAQQLRLFVLPPSHYCERARWALDHAGVDYTEERWAVGLHVLLARRLAGATTLPILRTGRETIQGSDRILEWTDMAGADAALERRFETRIGALVRQYLYAATLGDPRSGVRDILFNGISAGQASLGRLAWPITRRLMVAGMNARPFLVPEIEQKLAVELDWFDEQIGDRRYFVDDQFGRADITAASLLAPLARPAACPLYRKALLPERVEETLMRWSARPGLEWVRRMYTEHRRCTTSPTRPSVIRAQSELTLPI